jgi:hypothetical protein
LRWLEAAGGQIAIAYCDISSFGGAVPLTIS